MTCQLPLPSAQEGGGRVVERGVERHLRLHAGDAVDREAVLALEILDQRRELRVETIVARLRRPAGR